MFMKKEFSSGLSWNSAAISGLAMAAGTVALDYLGGLAGSAGGFFGTFLVLASKILKIAVCVWLFHSLMARFYNTVETDYASFQRYGLKLALFSSILVAGFSLLQMLVISPEAYSEIVNQTMAGYESMLDSNTKAAMEGMLGKLPAITFTFTLAYCFLWGWVLSTTFARTAFPPDEFGDRGGNGGSEGNGWNGGDRNATDNSNESPDNQ